MFLDFFYELRNSGIKVTQGELLTLEEALKLGFSNCSLEDFYFLSRAILVKTETNYDLFDNIFGEIFKDVHKETKIGRQFLDWLDKSDLTNLSDEESRFYLNKDEDLKTDKEEVEENFKKKKEEQTSEHNGGNTWIGTMGKTSYGNTGGNMGGIRIGGKTGHQSAFSVIGEHKYRDFRNDRILDNRQFQMALRKLRQFSMKIDIPRTELDINSTIQETCNQGGMLKIVMDKPRKNTVKLLLLMDSGGTMIPYSQLMNELFQSVDRSNHFKDVKTYYFHNCIYSKLYKTPECENGDWVDTDWVFRQLDKDYKVIIVGDAAMAPEELYSDSGNYRGPNGGLTGYEWLLKLKRNYTKIIWLNPKMAAGHAPWREAETAVKEILPMYRLTVDGLNKGMEVLLGKNR